MTFDPNTPVGNPNPQDGDGRPQPARPTVPSFIPASVAAKAANPEPRKSKTSAMAIALVAALVIAGAGLGFAGGRLTAPAAPARGNFGNGGNGGFQPGGSGAPGGNRGGFGGFGGGNIALTGTVTAMANGTITVQTSAGQNVTVELPAGVTYHAQASAASTDVSVGSSVELTVKTPGGRVEASGAPGASPAPGGNGGFNLSASDILVLSK